MKHNWKIYTDPKGTNYSKLMGYIGTTTLGPESYVIKQDGSWYHYDAPEGCTCPHTHAKSKP